MTATQMAGSLEVIAAVAEAIRELGEVPSGKLYSILMGSGISLSSYTNIIATLKRAELVSESAHVLRWVGPSLTEA